jgi:anti-sigma28 factor (negative regulator of flagellin synthesis)
MGAKPEERAPRAAAARRRRRIRTIKKQIAEGRYRIDHASLAARLARSGELG